MWWILLVLLIIFFIILFITMALNWYTPNCPRGECVPRPTSVTQPAKVLAVKSQLRNLSKQYQGDCNQQVNNTIRPQLDTLVDQLLSLTPYRTEKEYLPLVLGGWQQIWADGPTGPPPGSGGPVICTVSSQIYQVVYQDGYYWNLSKNIINGKVSTGYLRGEYQLQGNDDPLSIVFTQQTGTTHFPFSGTPLKFLTDQAEDGLFDAGNMEGYPVGSTGTLANIYVDDDFRVVHGTAPQYPGQTFLYILNRTQVISN
jgi:hypothetical protein